MTTQSKPACETERQSHLDGDTAVFYSWILSDQLDSVIEPREGPIRTKRQRPEIAQS